MAPIHRTSFVPIANRFGLNPLMYGLVFTVYPVRSNIWRNSPSVAFDAPACDVVRCGVGAATYVFSGRNVKCGGRIGVGRTVAGCGVCGAGDCACCGGSCSPVAGATVCFFDFVVLRIGKTIFLKLGCIKKYNPTIVINMMIPIEI